jgi:hypothetical protein
MMDDRFESWEPRLADIPEPPVRVVDVSPESLTERLAQGSLYRPDPITGKLVRVKAQERT